MVLEPSSAKRITDYILASPNGTYQVGLLPAASAISAVTDILTVDRLNASHIGNRDHVRKFKWKSW